MKHQVLAVSTLTCIGLLQAGRVHAEPSTGLPIVPNQDGTGTIVIPKGNTFDIGGGTLSGDGTNLFHSFEKFGINQAQIANFLSNPNLRNILGRVTGGEISVIDGLIRVTGGDTNLYLMNPTGIIFGRNAALNVPASFTATTANAIGFGNDRWFNFMGGSDYANLMGTPDRLAFTLPQSGTILNLGTLVVDPSENITLIGGSLASVERLWQQNSSVTTAAVASGTIVRFKPTGSLINLEFEVIAPPSEPGTDVPYPVINQDLDFPIVSLPELLTGGNGGNATNLVINDNGVLQLTGSGINYGNGTDSSGPNIATGSGTSPLTGTPTTLFEPDSGSVTSTPGLAENTPTAPTVESLVITTAAPDGSTSSRTATLTLAADSPETASPTTLGSTEGQIIASANPVVYDLNGVGTETEGSMTLVEPGDTLPPGAGVAEVTPPETTGVEFSESANPLSADGSTSNAGSPEVTDSADPSAAPALPLTDDIKGESTVTPIGFPKLGGVVAGMSQIEQRRANEFQQYLGEGLQAQPISSRAIRETLQGIAQETGKTPAILYAFVQPDQLELVLVTPNAEPIYKRVTEAKRDLLLKEVEKFTQELQTPPTGQSTGYIASAQRLYQWLIAPLAPELATLGVDTLLFSLDPGLRTLPVAALYDGKQFLIEKYSLGITPSMMLTDTRYVSLKHSKVLALGQSEFDARSPLPAVPLELGTIVQDLWRGKALLNESFTLDQLKGLRGQGSFPIVHLATHANFQPGDPTQSYIQLWDTKLRLDQLRKLSWNNPPLELLVLSACRTAIGDEAAELGFAGLAVQAGAKSVLASLWYVNDAGTLGLMTEFYRQLQEAPIKAEALREAQIAMLKGQVRVTEGELLWSDQQRGIELPGVLSLLGDQTLSHPYYWAAFTLVGSPW